MFEGMEVIGAAVIIDDKQGVQAQLGLPREGEPFWVTTRYGWIPLDQMYDDAARRKFWQDVYTSLLQDVLRYVVKRDNAWVPLGRPYKPGERDAIEAEIAAKVISAPTDDELVRWNLKTSQQQVDGHSKKSQNWRMILN